MLKSDPGRHATEHKPAPALPRASQMWGVEPRIYGAMSGMIASSAGRACALASNHLATEL
jgi:hypothetical protein